MLPDASGLIAGRLPGRRCLVTSNDMNDRFQQGDHLQVRRPMLYDHHGVYVSDDRVIQFGGGIWDKPHAVISAVSLKEFEHDGTARVVRHGRDSWFTGHHPSADARWKIVERAEFLLRLQPKLRYNVIGYNCEHVANMCVSGGWTESYQIRRIFGVRACAGAAFMFWLARRSRAKLPLSGWVPPYVILSLLVTVVTIGTYNAQIKRFWGEIGPQLARARARLVR